jgi:hypothetical protein
MKQSSYAQSSLVSLISQHSAHIFLLFITVVLQLSLYQKSLVASESTFFCGSESYRGETVPTTYINPETGGQAIAFIYWVSDYFENAGGTPQRRCEEVSRRLQAYYDAGLLEHINTGIVNDLSVICIARSTDNRCTDSDIIVTLAPNVDRFNALRVMTHIRRQVNLRPLELTDDLIVYQNGEAYINFEVFIERLTNR